MKRKMKNNKSWVIKVRCVVTKDVVCDGCSREQALAHPFRYAVDEQETELEDWTVLQISENE